MRRREPPILGFRRRLQRAMDERCEGKYTVLARRAHLPVSTLQHIVHHAKRLPGGEHLLRLADALGVSVHYLMAGDAAGRVPDPPALPTPPIVTFEGAPFVGMARHLALPVFRCGCPGACPLTEVVPPGARKHFTLVLEAALTARHAEHRLLAVQVDPRLPCPGWPVGARLVVDWDARTPEWAALTLLHTEGRCRLGHVMPAGDRLLFAPRLDGVPEVVSRAGRVLGTIVAGVTAL